MYSSPAARGAPMICIISEEFIADSLSYNKPNRDARQRINTEELLLFP